MAHNDIFMFVDESGCDHNSKILALACIITTNPEGLRREIKKLQNEILRDPILRHVSSVQNSLSKHGFHYCEDHGQDVKPKVIDLIMTLPFEAYIIYQKKDINFDLDQVSKAFKQLGCQQDIALVFAHLCTLHGKLVQGASTSPVLANLICTELDQKLLDLAESYSCSYSRYAHDITFPGEHVPCKKKIKKCLQEYGFELNSGKYKRQSRGKRHYVTGLTVFDSNQPRIAKKIKKELRQVIYYASKYGWDNHFSKSNRSSFSMRRMDGMIAFVYSVEPKCAMRLDIEWQKILKKTRGSVSRKDPHAIYKRRSELTEPGI
jgi:Reverse transcriptase (RNA-dependent DNA polymerase)